MLQKKPGSLVLLLDDGDEPRVADIDSSGRIIMYSEDIYTIKFDDLSIGSEELIERIILKCMNS